LVVSLEEESLLNSFGLTPSQVRVYLTLTYNGSSKVSQISKNSGIHRTHLYQILHSLEAAGLVEKNLVDGFFTPLPLKDALDMVIQQKQKELKTIEATAKTIVDNSKTSLSIEKKPEMLLLTNGCQISKKIQKCTEKASKTIALMQSWTRFLLFWSYYSETYSAAMARGVIVKQIVEYPEDKQQARQFLSQKIFSNPLFQVRFVSKTGGNFVIVDDEKVLVSTSAEKKILREAPLIFSNYKGLLETMKNYFSVTWANGITLDTFKQ
jgi:sugar-specific transcriptional regulator TrmB